VCLANSHVFNLKSKCSCESVSVHLDGSLSREHERRGENAMTSNLHHSPDKAINVRHKFNWKK